MVQIISINDTAYVPLPFEVTGMAGARISSALAGVNSPLGNDIGVVNVLSCSNGYWGYLTTPQEYDQQHYEGASNLYGPEMLTYLIQKLEGLSSEMPLDWKDWRYTHEDSPGSKIIQTYKSKTVHVNMTNSFPVQFKEGDEVAESYWSYLWQGDSPEILDFARSFVRIEKLSELGTWEPYKEGHRPIDDLGTEISLEIVGKIPETDQVLYEFRWYADADISGTYRFAVIDPQGYVVTNSDTFGDVLRDNVETYMVQDASLTDSSKEKDQS